MGVCLIAKKTFPLINILDDIEDSYFHRISVNYQNTVTYTLNEHAYLYICLVTNYTRYSYCYCNDSVIAMSYNGADDWCLYDCRSYSFATKGSIIKLIGGTNASNTPSWVQFYRSKTNFLGLLT